MTEKLSGWDPVAAGQAAAAAERAGAVAVRSTGRILRPQAWAFTSRSSPEDVTRSSARSNERGRRQKLLSRKLDTVLAGGAFPDPDNLIGERFGLVTVIAKAESIRTGKRWKVRCECGAERILRWTDLCRRPKTHRSCGGKK